MIVKTFEPGSNVETASQKFSKYMLIQVKDIFPFDR